jgi:hypothetical protein
MSSAPVKKLPASASVRLPGVLVTDRGGEEVNIGFSNFRTGNGDELRDPGLEGPSCSLVAHPRRRRTQTFDTQHTAKWEVLQLCRYSVIGWPDAPPGLFGLWTIQVAPI